MVDGEQYSSTERGSRQVAWRIRRSGRYRAGHNHSRLLVRHKRANFIGITLMRACL
jgi:hypothetical protein